MVDELARSRKDDHVRLAAGQQVERPARNGFDDVSFVHHALDGIDVHLVDLSTTVAGATWRAPLYINAMTGGSDTTGRINRELAIAARESGVAMASGSMSIALGDPSVLPTFRVIREENPHGFVMANIGVERSADDARRAVDLLQADALQIHINAVQETVMPEGSRSFSTWEASLEAIVGAVDVPVVVKEVGFGLSARTLSRLSALGVRTADVSGRGGTDFVRIENDRRAGGDYAYLAGWGQTALECLLEAPADAPELLASGGVRTPLDVMRALALGARAVGVSGSFLTVAMDGGASALTDLLAQWLDHLRALHALLGATTPAALSGTDLIVRAATAEFCAARGIDLTALGRRSARSSEGSRP